ncbi:MAG TPA: cation:proton antiporter [Methanoregulaceae archaeon]|nr:cation:proton antiporter [Methanoregulaceae archaeon]
MEGIVLALFVCLILALFTKRFSLPSIPFYIIAGLLLGQSGLQLVAADEISRFLTHLGLLFLLFFIGLEIKPDRIWHNQSAIISSGLIDLNINALIGFIIAYAMGFSLFDAMVVAMAFYISSTAMAVTSLIENKKLLLRESETVVWLMIFEDIALIVFLALLGSSKEHPLLIIAKICLVLGVILAITHFGKKYIISVLKRDDELPVLLTFSAVLGIAALSSTIGIPESFMVIAFGTILGTIDPIAFEIHSRPFKDVFLVVFFVFFGITVNIFSGGISLPAVVAISLVAILSKFASGMAVGRYIHKNAYSGIEIWSNTISRGEFSIAIAAIYGSAVVSGTIASMVIITSIIGAFVAKYSGRIQRIIRASGKPRNPETQSSKIKKMER